MKTWLERKKVALCLIAGICAVSIFIIIDSSKKIIENKGDSYVVRIKQYGIDAEGPTYPEYKKALQQFGHFYFDYSGYISSKYLSKWSLQDLIKVENNMLAFLKGDDFVFTGVEQSDADELVIYFNNYYENSVKNLNQRMSAYIGKDISYLDWALAREYLILSFIDNNADLEFLEDYYTGVSELNEGRALGQLVTKNSNAINIYKKSWDTLNDEQKADLEFYTILTLTSDFNSDNYGFSQMYTNRKLSRNSLKFCNCIQFRSHSEQRFHMITKKCSR